jgi:hypothetical protein
MFLIRRSLQPSTSTPSASQSSHSESLPHPDIEEQVTSTTPTND